MARTFATVVTVVGLALAGGSLLLLMGRSGLVAGRPEMTSVATWVVVFLIGIFVFGWGLGKRTGP